MTVEALRSIVTSLVPSERNGLDVLLISMDPERDTPQALSQLARERHVSDPHWTFARTSAPETRRIAAALGIQYRQLPSGDFEHSTELLLLDANGRIRARSSQLSAPDPEFVRAIRGTLKN